jgi:hypothetical protein
MRWNNLFDDLESQLEQELTAEEIDLKAEEERLRLGRLSIRDRIVAIQAAEGRDSQFTIRLQLSDASVIFVRPLTFGKDWFAADLIEESQRHSQCVVPLAAITEVVLGRAQIEQSLRMPDAPESGRSLSARLSLAFVLRDLCRRRKSMELHLTTGLVHGTIDRVGRDHIDVAVHDAGTPRRENEVNQYRVVPLGQIVLVRL